MTPADGEVGTGSSAAFAAVHGREPTVAWRAPGRVNLIGEHTDYNDGWVLPLALTLGTTVRAAPRPDRVLRLVTHRHAAEPVDVDLDHLAPGTVTGWAAYPAGVAWALAERGVPVVGADVLVDGDLPLGAGLSSSASLELATAGALLALAGADLDLVETALLAQRAENEFVGVPCGVMDQMASALGRAGHLLLLDARSLAVRQVPFDPAAHGLALLVVDTRARHALVDGGYADRRAACETAARMLGVPALRDVTDLDAALARLPDPVLRARVRHVVGENGRVRDVVERLDRGDLRGVGEVLTASHVSLRDDFAVSCLELDLVVDTALGAGALGARMTGGGFGGSAIALVDVAEVETVREAVLAAFHDAGLHRPAFVDATPGDGAGPLR
ncbi:MAG: galactokinase [Frankiales bacterium]|nr:galactokinase [Frankiales bacterium]